MQPVIKPGGQFLGKRDCFVFLNCSRSPFFVTKMGVDFLLIKIILAEHQVSHLLGQLRMQYSSFGSFYSLQQGWFPTVSSPSWKQRLLNIATKNGVKFVNSRELSE